MCHGTYAETACQPNRNPSPSLQFEPVLDDAAPLVDIVVRGLPYQVSSHARLPYASRCVTCSTGLRVVGP